MLTLLQDFFIVGATIIASIAIYAGGKGELAYINALMFASGANTQAGLNPVDINTLNLFQQIVMYIFPMLANPITLHGSVVFLRLYWFEKRFQGVVKDAKNRRATITKSRSQARDDLRRAENGINVTNGVNGRHITVVPHNGRTPRMTNDGIILEGDQEPKKPASSSDESDETVSANPRGDSMSIDPLDRSQPQATMSDVSVTQFPAFGDDQTTQQAQINPRHHPTAISFASTVKRSDGIDGAEQDFARRRRPTYEHIAILERQRNQDNEVLRIPGPRDAERGLGPRRLDEGDGNEEDDSTLYQSKTREWRPGTSAAGSTNVPVRQPTITIAEPSHHKKEELADDVKAAGGVLEALRFRKPRAFNSQQKRYHEDDEHRGRTTTRSKTIETIRSALSRDKHDDMPYLSYTPTMGRNSNFVGLTLEQREELGGIEYRSLRTLAIVLLGYFWGFQLIALTFLLPYILHKNQFGQVVEEAGTSRTWWAFWTANVAFMDVGFTLTPDSMVSFQKSDFILMVMAFFVIIGNTAFPVMLRFIIWTMAKIVPKGSGLWEELRFLLDHPRRCFTLLFPSAANWWLFGILFALNAVDVIFFIILDLNSAVVEDLPVHSRIANGLFQAASTRTAGFASLPLSELHPAMPVLYMIMMYISVFPIAISIRRTNVYEERSLGIYPGGKLDDEDEADDPSALSYVGSHLRRQLSFDLWFVFLGFFLITVAEGSKIKEGRFDAFTVLFEVVSAYGTVGMSMGATGVNASLCSQFSVVGKLVIVAMEIRGRHRGLPYGLDRAVLLPSESRFQSEAEELHPVITRTNTGPAATVRGASQRRGSSVGRGRSMSRERDRRILTKLLHPGPVIPPGLAHSSAAAPGGHSRTRSNGSDMSGFSHSLYPVQSHVSRPRRPSIHTLPEEAVEDEEGEDLAPVTSNGSVRPRAPRRSETSPAVVRTLSSIQQDRQEQ